MGYYYYVKGTNQLINYCNHIIAIANNMDLKYMYSLIIIIVKVNFGCWLVIIISIDKPQIFLIKTCKWAHAHTNYTESCNCKIRTMIIEGK